MKNHSVAGWSLLIAISAFEPVNAQTVGAARVEDESRILVAIDLPSLVSGGEGEEKLRTDNYWVLPVPSCAARDVVFLARNIELSPEQSQEIDGEIQHATLNYLRDLQQLDDATKDESEAIRKLKLAQDRFRRQAESIVHEALLPHQREKLRQAQIRYTVQQFSRSADAANILKSELGLTEEQLERLRGLSEQDPSRLHADLETMREARQLEMLKEALGEETFQKLVDYLENR